MIVVPTTVICVRGKDRAAMLADPGFVYVGWAVPRRGWERSIWANPYRLGKSKCGYIDQVVEQRATKRLEETGLRGAHHYCRLLDAAEREVLLERYFAHLVQARLLSRVVELRGKTLGCWCGDWKPGEPEFACHAIVLAKLADDRIAHPV